MMQTAHPPRGEDPVLKGRVGAGVRCAYRLFYPRPLRADALFTQAVDQYLDNDARVLDAGCGSGAIFPHSWKEEVEFLVGCDLGNAIRRNQNINAGVNADLSMLPFKCESFDIIFSRYVFEHIQAPDQVFTEIARVLKPNGKLIILTPSRYHYVTFLSRLMPHSIHERVAAVRGNAPEDTFPTVYLANTRPELAANAKRAGLSLIEFITHEPPPGYLLWSLPSFLLGVAFERLVNRFESLKSFRVSIIAVFER